MRLLNMSSAASVHQQNDTTGYTAPPKPCHLQKLPLENNHAIFEYLLQPPSVIELNKDQTPYSVLEVFGPLAAINKEFRDKVVEWYSHNRSKYNLTTTKGFGQIDVDSVRSTLHVCHQFVNDKCGRTNKSGGSMCYGTLCPCQIRNKLDLVDLQVIRKLRLFFVGQDCLRQSQSYNSNVLSHSLANCRALDSMDVYACWKAREGELFPAQTQLAWTQQPTGYLIPTGVNTLSCCGPVDDSARPSVTFWYGGEAMDKSTPEQTDMSSAQKVWEL
jgi:hypothetical protein